MLYYCTLQDDNLDTVYYVECGLIVKDNMVIIQSQNAAGICYMWFGRIEKSSLPNVSAMDFLEIMESVGSQWFVFASESFLKDKKVVYTDFYKKNKDSVYAVIDFNTGTFKFKDS